MSPGRHIARAQFQRANYKNFYGIFIGIENFPGANGKIKSLLYSNEDAHELCNFFLEHCKSLDKPYEISLFVNDDYIEKTTYDGEVKVDKGTRVNILGALSNYLSRAKSHDLFLVYISTHGEIDYNDYFFIPSDGIFSNILGTGISSNTLIQALAKVSSREVNVLMLIDTCYSGAISFDIAKYKGAFSCLLSASPVEYSYEFGTLKHGAFTYYLLEALRTYKAEEKTLTLVELYDYIYKKVQLKTKKKQNPLMTGTMSYNFPIL